MAFLIGIDDTDNLESRGTGFRARKLGVWLAARGLGEVRGITRHQLLVDPRIPYTSHNSSLCLSIEAEPARLDEIARFCRDYLARESAPGSDAGLCVAENARIGSAVKAYGVRAKREVLNRRSAMDLAEREEIVLEGVTGDHGGVIGALAAIGLRATEGDGRFVWLPGLRELSGVLTAEALYRTTDIDEIQTVSGRRVPDQDRIDTSPWPRPVLIEGRAVLLVQEMEENDASIDWRLAPKDIVKRY
ncbi:MAG: hypothetical protein ACE5H8_05715 [Alphaproteobacteria bacterium]